MVRAVFRKEGEGSRGVHQGVRQVEDAEPAQHVGAGPGAAPVVLLRDGALQGRHRPAVRRRRHHLERGGTLQHLAGPAGAGGEAGRGARRGDAQGVHDDHRDRRDRHGPPGDEGVARQPRGDRGFDRAYRAGARLRRARGLGRVRQVPARPHDGDGAAQRAGRLHVRRLDPAGALQGPGRDRAGRVRGRGPARRRQDVRRGPGRIGAGRLPLGRVVRRAVHRQHDGLRLGGDRARSPRARPGRPPPWRRATAGPRSPARR